jgi:ABC-2 type transport system permease protein
MTDTFAVAWKEWRELLGQRGFRGKMGIVLFLVAFGIVIPLQTGPAWITSPAVGIAWSWVPMFLVSTVIADAFAGERERHTLETLLATRLSDGAILFGKMGAAIGYAGALTCGSLVLAEVAVNLVWSHGGVLLYKLEVVLAIAVVGFLGAVFVAAVGVLISLRAATVRQAQQTLSGTIIVVLLLVVAGVRFLPGEWKRTVAASAPTGLLIAVLSLGAFALFDIGVVALAMLRFRRSRLIAG